MVDSRYFAVLVLLALLIIPVAATDVQFFPTTASDARMSNSTDPTDVYLWQNSNGPGTAIDSSTAIITGIGVAANTVTGRYATLVRYGACVDSSSIPDAATVDSARFYIKGYNSTTTNGLGNISAMLVAFNPSNPSTLVYGDFDQFGVIYNDTPLRHRVGWNKDGYNEYTLNAAGLANVSKTGTTCVGLVMLDDYYNTSTELEWHAYANSVLKVYQNGTEGSSPYLNVSYTLAAGDTITVTSPNGGESWTRGTPHSVTWSYTGTPGANVNLTLMKAGAEAGVINGSVSIGSGGTGSYTWDIWPTGTTGSDYTVRIASTTNATVNDTSNAQFSLVMPGSSDNRTWDGTYDFYPPNNIINRNISTLPVHTKSSAWITNLSQLAGRIGLPAVTSHSQPWTTETTWVVNTDTDPLTWLVSATDTYNMHDNVAAIPIPSGMWVNPQATDYPAALFDFDNTLLYSIGGASNSSGYWTGSVGVWNWSDNRKRFTNSSSSSIFYNNNWNGHFYVRGNNGTVNRSETTQIWGGRCMIDMPCSIMTPTYDEVAADDVDHALYIIVPYAGNASSTLWPASNTGDSGERINCIAPGARLRLKSSYDISGFSAQPKALLKGAKYWGGIVGDNGASYGIQIYITNDTRWSTTQLNELKTVPLSAWEVVDESSLMINRYSMESLMDAPVASFAQSGTSGTSPYSVSFLDTSTNYPTAWQWTASLNGTGTASTFSTSQNPTYSFYTGNWKILLTATNTGGSNTSTQNSWVNVSASGAVLPTANFTCTPTTGMAPLTSTCTDSSTGSPTSWVWSWKPVYRGDEYYTDFSTVQNPVYAFPYTDNLGIAPGHITVKLVATNSAGSNTTTRSDYIVTTASIVAPVANFTPQGDYYNPFPPFTPDTWIIHITEGTTVQFNDTSSGTPTTWNWTFQTSDSAVQYSSEQNPSFLYNSGTVDLSGDRTFGITLTATNSMGTSSTSGRYIHVAEPPVIPIPVITATNIDTSQSATYQSGTSSAVNITVSSGQTVSFSMSGSLNTPTSLTWQINAGNGSTYTYGGNPTYNNPTNFTYTATTGGYAPVTIYLSNDAGTSVLHAYYLIYILDAIAPPALSGLTSTNGSTSILWNWTADPEVDHIMIWRDGVALANVTGTGTLWTGLTPLTEYAIATKTVDSLGNVNGTFVNSTGTTLAGSWNWSTGGTCSNWVAPYGVTTVTLKGVGGGASGQGGQSTLRAGSGGHRGEYATYVNLPVIPLATYQICVGEGGGNSSYNTPANAGNVSSALGKTFNGGLPGDDLVAVGSGGPTKGGDGEDGVWSTTRFALNGTQSDAYDYGISGIGYGAAGGGASHDTTVPIDTQGGYGAGGYIEITISSASTTNTPDFVADKTESAPGSLIHFTDMSTIIDTAGISYNWSFGDGGYSSVVGDTQHVFPYTGSYDISLVITTANGSVTETKPTYINIVEEQMFINPPTPVMANFHVITGFGEPVAEVDVSITPVSTSTGDWDWLAAMFGMDLNEVKLNSTTLHQSTDSFGTASFLVLSTTKYNVTFVKEGYTIPSLLVVPTVSDYWQYATATGEGDPNYEHGMNELEAIAITVTQTDINETASVITLNYNDRTGKTVGGYVDVVAKNSMPREAPTTIVRWNITSSNQSESVVVPHAQQVDGSVRATVVHEDFGNVTRTYPFSMKGAPVNFMGFGAEIRLLVALGVMLLTVMLAGATTGRPIVVVMAIEGWIFYTTGFFQALINRGTPDTSIVLSLILVTVIGIAANIPYRRK